MLLGIILVAPVLVMPRGIVGVFAWGSRREQRNR